MTFHQLDELLQFNQPFFQRVKRNIVTFLFYEAVFMEMIE